ncbi:MAG: prepilin-type N-terminal cleavage/methylation domain-containing protein [Terriglobales bacterium]|jgi:general secretion pathway protein G
MKITSKSKARASSARKMRGFTLMEMMIVIVIMGVLMALAIPMYNQSITRSKEAKLRNDVVTLNKLIQEYSLDKKKAPQQLQDLVDAGYLKFLPEDITGSATTWQTEMEDSEKATDPNEPGIISVHSGSDQPGSDGQAYSSYGTGPVSGK